jgi:hypothetical protein
MAETRCSVKHALMESERWFESRKPSIRGYASGGLGNPKTGTIKVA